jgi:uncharacterized protein YjbI with pentapeptide repeats
MNTPAVCSVADHAGIDLTDTFFGNAKLDYADLSHTNLAGVDLVGASITYANLNYANLSNAFLEDVNLNQTTLKSSDTTRVGWVRATCPAGVQPAGNPATC